MKYVMLIFLLLGITLSTPLQAQSPSCNYVMACEMLDTTGTNCHVRLQYYDGIGRPTQLIESQGGGAYSATLAEYDPIGRPVKEWLPTPVGGSLNCMPTSALADKAQKFYGDRHPFSLASYDVIDRTTAVLGAGDAWASGDHAAKCAFSCNATNEVLRFDAPLNDTTVVSAGYYEAGSLRVETATDEDGYIDRLRYSYVGNRVVKIDDDVDDGPAYKDAFHFVDGADKDVEYAYDANGNMTKDLNKGITAIEYNCLNLPKEVHFNSLLRNKTITYGYDADGTKTSATYVVSSPKRPGNHSTSTGIVGSIGDTGNKTTFVDGSPTVSLPSTGLEYLLSMSRTDYCGNIVYENDTLKRVLIDGGYLTFAHTKGGSLSAPQYHFYMKDHLGNNRVVVDGSGKVEEDNNYYPYGGLMADNTNIKNVQPYKYVGKELDGMFGWNMLDHGARWYDAAIGRWWNMDLLAEKYYWISPYISCADNPLKFVDIDGKKFFFKVLQKSKRFCIVGYKVLQITSWGISIKTEESLLWMVKEMST